MNLIKCILFIAVSIVVFNSCKQKSEDQTYFREKFKNMDSVRVWCYRPHDTLNYIFKSGRDIVIFRNIVGKPRPDKDLTEPFKKVVFYKDGKEIFNGTVGTGGLEFTTDENKETIKSRVSSTSRQYLDQICEGIPKN